MEQVAGTAPIMWFFIAEGYFYTKNLKKYAGRLFFFALISHAVCFLEFPRFWPRETIAITAMQLQSEQKVIRQIPSKINVLHQFFKRDV